MKKIKICLDVDGVLLNFLQTISVFIEQEYKLPSKIAFCSTQYRALYERFEKEAIENIGFDNIKDRFEKAGQWSFLETMPEIDLVHDLVNNPLFELKFLTSLPVHLHAERLKNLTSILGTSICGQQLICVPLGESKKPYLEKINPDIFIEDNLQNLSDCYASHKSYWINLKENYYDESCLSDLNLTQVSSLNNAISDIKKSLYCQHIDTVMDKIKISLPHDTLTSQQDYSCAEALYHMLGGKESDLILQCTKLQNNEKEITHWWLRNKDGKILDPTACFYGTPISYDSGEEAQFLNQYPSRLAKNMIENIVNEPTQYKLKI